MIARQGGCFQSHLSGSGVSNLLRTWTGCLVLVFLTIQPSARAQEPDPAPVDPEAPVNPISPANLTGASFEVFLELAGWEMDQYTRGIELGYGIGAKLGYGISQTFSMYISYDGANIVPRDIKQYVLSHTDLGVQYHFHVPPQYNYRYYIESSIGFRSVELETSDGLLNANGPGIAMGGGFKYFLSRNTAIDFGAKFSVVQLDDIMLNNRDQEASLMATTLRVRGGIMFFIDR